MGLKIIVEHKKEDISLSSPFFHSSSYSSSAPSSSSLSSSSHALYSSSHSSSSFLSSSAHAPSTYKIFIKTYGCSHNISDSEYMAGQLQEHGYTLVDNETTADLLLVNSCTVKGPSQDSFLSTVRAAKQRNQRIVVAGCVPQADQRHRDLLQLSVIGVRQINRVVEVVDQTLQGNVIRLFEKAHKPSLDLPKIRKNRLVEIIPISIGCLGACTYCKTKHARGHLGSYEPDAILQRVKNAIAEGVTELWLTSEDSGAYGKDIGTNLPKLLSAILVLLESEAPQVMLRLGMTNPPYILEHLDAMAQILTHKNAYAFLHIPVQSASNKVLGAMNREYTVQEFQRVVDYLKEKVSGLTIATDIICGFPNEDDDDVEQTLAFVEKNVFPVLNISQFYPRPQTPAARMRLLPTQLVKARSTRLTQLFKTQRPYDALIGKTERVWINNVNDDGQLLGHTKSYVPVLLPYDEALLGKSVHVHILSAGKHFVKGIVVNSAVV